MKIGIVVILVGALALLGSAAGDGGQARQKATLKMSPGAPLTIRGAHFRPSERVRVTVSSELTRTKRVTATPTGTFVLRFVGAFDRCSGLIALAIGERGSRAMLKQRPQPACPAP